MIGMLLFWILALFSAAYIMLKEIQLNCECNAVFDKHEFTRSIRGPNFHS